MDTKRIKKLIWYGILVVLCILLGMVTAPLGVPLVKTFAQGGSMDLSPLLIYMNGEDVFLDLMAYLSGAAASSDTLSYLIAWCAALSVFAVLAVLAKRTRTPGRNVEKGILGDAHLIKDDAEIRRTNDFWDGNGEPKEAGLVLSSSKKGYFFDSAVPHWCVIGKTGSGKSFLVIINTLHVLMAKGWNLIVTGKNELLELTGAKAVELGYKRFILDLKGYPGASRFNPLDLIVEYADQGEIDKAQRAARQLAADLIPLRGETNEYFSKAARSLLTALILLVVLADIPREQKNMTSVCNIINVGTTGDGSTPSAPLKDYIRSDAVGPSHPAYGLLVDFQQDGGQTTAGKNVLSTLQEGLSIFNDKGIAHLTSQSDICLGDLLREKSVVYIHLPEENDPYTVIFAAFLNQWWRVAQDMTASNAGRLPHETAILGDEWGNLPKVACLPEIVTLGRSYKLHAYCFMQDLKQWNKYNVPGDQGAGRDKILGSMGGKMALSLANPEDFQYFTRLAGKRTVRTQNSSTSKQSSVGGTSSGSSEGYTECAVDLMPEWDWQNRIPARDGVICIKGGENSKPGREGVFEMPVTYASQTPAASFFSLGSVEECIAKQVAFRKAMERSATATYEAEIPSWTPDFEAFRYGQSIADDIDEDEYSAWKGI